MRTYTIELRADFQSEEKYDILTEAAREKARELLAIALMIKDKRDPQISFSTGDMFERNNDLTIMSAEGEETVRGE